LGCSGRAWPPGAAASLPTVPLPSSTATGKNQLLVLVRALEEKVPTRRRWRFFLLRAWRWRLGATACFSFFVQWSANAKEPREADGSLKTLPLEWNRARGRASNVGASAHAKNLKTRLRCCQGRCGEERCSWDMALSKSSMLGKCLVHIAPVPPCSLADAVAAAG
jgi:hypothetical protein